MRIRPAPYQLPTDRRRADDSRLSTGTVAQRAAADSVSDRIIIRRRRSMITRERSGGPASTSGRTSVCENDSLSRARTTHSSPVVQYLRAPSSHGAVWSAPLTQLPLTATRQRAASSAVSQRPTRSSQYVSLMVADFSLSQVYVSVMRARVSCSVSLA